MAIPNCEQIIRDLAAQYPAEWRKAHNPSGGGPETEAFIRRVAWVLHSTVDARFGLNGKRGNYNDISDDVVNWLGEGPGHDPATGQPVTVIDVIAGAGGPDPKVYWGLIDAPGPGGWVKPGPVDGASSGGGGTPPTPAPPAPVPGPDYTAKLDALTQATAALGQSVAQATAALGQSVARIEALLVRVEHNAGVAAHESLNAAVRASEIKTQIDNLPTPGSPTSFPAYEGRVFGSKVRLEPK